MSDIEDAANVTKLVELAAGMFPARPPWLFDFNCIELSTGIVFEPFFKTKSSPCWVRAEFCDSWEGDKLSSGCEEVSVHDKNGERRLTRGEFRIEYY
ncbi:MAG: hypothetical protein WDA27_12310 [Actinomycetota bacterium]